MPPSRRFLFIKKKSDAKMCLMEVEIACPPGVGAVVRKGTQKVTPL